MDDLSQTSNKIKMYDILRTSIRFIHCLQKERGVSCLCCGTGGEKPPMVRSVDDEGPSFFPRNNTSCNSLASFGSSSGLNGSNCNRKSFRDISSNSQKATDAALILLSRAIRQANCSAYDLDNLDVSVSASSRKNAFRNNLLQEITRSFDARKMRIQLATTRSVLNNAISSSSPDQPKVLLQMTFQVYHSYNKLVSDVIQSVCQLVQREISHLNKDVSTDCNRPRVQSLKEETKSGVGSGENPEIKKKNRRNKTLSSTIVLMSLQHDANGFEYTSLLGLLLSFVQIKESSGHERAILSSLLSVPETAVDIASTEFRFIFNDIVMLVEAQRTLTNSLKMTNREIRHGSYGAISVLVEEAIMPPGEMKKLLDLVRADFDLNELRRSIGVYEFVDTWTLYIDRLHSTELLLLEEIEPLMTASGSSLSEPLATIPASNPGNTPIERVTSISSFTSTLSRLSNSGRQGRPHIVAVEDDDINLKVLSVKENEPNTTCYSRSTSNQNSEDSSRRDLEDENSDCDNALSAGISEEPVIEDGWNIPLTEIKFLKRIGSGGASTNYLANWQSEKVCVKVASVTKLGLDGWRTEVNSLQRVHHPNIIRLLGTIYNVQPLTCCLVLEYCNLGDLGTILADAKQYPDLPADCFTKISHDIASGMKYLHSRNVLHRDIKPANVLLSGELVKGKFSAKLTDFGVAKFSTFQSIETNRPAIYDTELTAETGTYRYMAPEVIRHEKYSFEADVYSFALVLWSLFTRVEPFYKYDPIEAARQVALEEARPRISSKVPDIIAKLIERCWADLPSSRPSFDTICKELESMKKLFGTS